MSVEPAVTPTGRTLFVLLFAVSLTFPGKGALAQVAPGAAGVPVAVIENVEVADSTTPVGVVRTLDMLLRANLFEDPPPQDEPAPVIEIPTDRAGGSSVELVEERRVVRDGLTVIYGRDQTQEHATFMFVREGGSISRAQIQRHDELITITGPELVNGQVRVRLVVWQPSTMPEERSPNEALPQSRSDESLGSAIDPGTAPDQVIGPDNPPGPIKVDIMVVYTPEAAEQSPIILGEPIEQTIESSVLFASWRLEDQANIRLNLVYVGEIDYVENSDIAIDLERLECPCDHHLSGVGDNHLNAVFDIWKSTGADVVSLWIHSASNDAGYGNIMGTVSTDWAARAAHVVDWSAATATYSFDHELGHQFGARHNWEKDNTLAKPYVDNHGYINLGPDKVTIMAYATTCSIYDTDCTRSGIWSDPGYELGGPWGVSFPGPLPANNALALQTSALTVALFNTKHDLVGCCVKTGSIFNRTYRPGQCP